MASLARPQDPIVISEPYAVQAALAELGVSMDLIDDVRNAWAAAAKATTAFEPNMAAGIKGWCAGVGCHRERQCSVRPVDGVGWEAIDVRNLPLVRTTDKNRAVFITSGDRNTGHADRWPATKNHKGVVTLAAVARNGRQGSLFTLAGAAAAIYDADPVSIAKSTWALMIHATKKEVWAELSLPAFTTSGKIDDWHKRIILPVLSLTPASGITSGTGTPSAAGRKLTITVTRKTP